MFLARVITFLKKICTYLFSLFQTNNHYFSFCSGILKKTLSHAANIGEIKTQKVHDTHFSPKKIYKLNNTS